MTRAPMRLAGLALLLVMPIHVALRPEHGWILLSTCDVVAVVIGIGLVMRWHRAVAIGGLFALAVGLPAFAIGVLTTYHLNPTGVIVHLGPAALGAYVIARDGLPRRAALYAWLGHAATFVAGFLLAPAALNVNFAAFVWPPLAGVFRNTQLFQAALLALVLLLLLAAEAIVRLVRPLPARDVEQAAVRDGGRA